MEADLAFWVASTFRCTHSVWLRPWQLRLVAKRRRMPDVFEAPGSWGRDGVTYNWNWGTFVIFSRHDASSGMAEMRWREADERSSVVDLNDRCAMPGKHAGCMQTGPQYCELELPYNFTTISKSPQAELDLFWAPEGSEGHLQCPVSNLSWGSQYHRIHCPCSSWEHSQSMPNIPHCSLWSLLQVINQHCHSYTFWSVSQIAWFGFLAVSSV